MEISAKNFNLEIYSDSTYKFNSTDNKYNYDVIYFDEDKIKNRVNNYNNVSKFGISIENIVSGAKRKVLLVATGGGISSPTKEIVNFDELDLTLALGDSVFSINVENLSLTWKIKNENTVICFGIYKIVDGFIVHGELSVYKISLDGKILWEFYGRDIFVTQEGKYFIIEDNIIKVKDWENYLYKIDFNGKEVGSTTANSR